MHGCLLDDAAQFSLHVRRNLPYCSFGITMPQPIHQER